MSKSVQLIVGLALSFVLTLPSLANQATATTSSISQNQAIAMAGAEGAGEDLLVLREVQKAQQQAKQTQNQTAAAEVTHIPRQSTAPAVSHDKLILNNPVIDEALILTASEKAHLETQLRRIHEDKLAQMAVVIVPTTEGVDIFDYAYQVAKRWELGDKERDDGILMAVAINDRKLHIVTGYGVEGVLPDAAISRIIREDITPSFKTGAYAQGISAGIARIDERLRADPETLAKADKAHAQNHHGGEVDVLGLLIPAFIVGLFITSILGRFLGASISAGGFAFIALMSGAGLVGVLVLAFILWVALIILSRGGVSIPAGGGRIGGGSGGFGGGGFGGGFGSGGFGGGGGGFGGGGAGGSW